jgi:hypothetical protein
MHLLKNNNNNNNDPISLRQGKVPIGWFGILRFLKYNIRGLFSVFRMVAIFNKDRV